MFYLFRATGYVSVCASTFICVSIFFFGVYAEVQGFHPSRAAACSAFASCSFLGGSGCQQA